MNESSSADSLGLLWVLGAVVACLSAQVAMGWVRVARRGLTPRRRWTALALAAAAQGGGLCAAVILILLAEGLRFPIGFRTSGVAALWLGSIAGCLAVVSWPAWWPGTPSAFGSALLLALLALGLQVGWLSAAGFIPGLLWRADAMTAGALVMLVGCGGGHWMAYLRAEQSRRRRRLWRVGGALVLGLGVCSSQELMSDEAGIHAQAQSAYTQQLPAVALGLVAGVVVPVLLLVMVIDLALRQPNRTGPGSKMAPEQRHRRRRPSQTP